MKALLLVLSTALLAAGGATAHSWLEEEPEKHPAVTTFEVFYWKLQRNDLDAAGLLVAPGSEAELALAVDRAIAIPNDMRSGVARGFALDLDVDAGDDHAGRPAVFLAGEATVNVDPKGFVSAFGEPELHEVEARLVEHDGAWRVAAYRDLRLAR